MSAAASATRADRSPSTVALRLGAAGLLPFVAGALLPCHAVDRRVCPAHGLAAWLTLRFRLGTVAALSCFVGAAGS